MIAETPHMITAPRTPKTPIVNPSDPNRKPGLHIAIASPSHQRRDFTSWRSSTTAVAIAQSSPVFSQVADVPSALIRRA